MFGPKVQKYCIEGFDTKSTMEHSGCTSQFQNYFTCTTSLQTHILSIKQYNSSKRTEWNNLTSSHCLLPAVPHSEVFYLKLWFMSVQKCSFIKLLLLLYWRKHYNNKNDTSTCIGHLQGIVQGKVDFSSLIVFKRRFLVPWFIMLPCSASIFNCLDFLGPFAKLWKAITSFVLSVCLSGLPPNDYPWNLRPEHFSKSCWQS